jgi:hypothetical protein
MNNQQTTKKMTRKKQETPTNEPTLQQQPKFQQQSQPRDEQQFTTNNEPNGADAAPVPVPFVAVTINVYVLPNVKFTTVHVVPAGEPDDEHVPNAPPSDDVAVTV